MIYAITGGYGFLGWHLRCRLRAESPAIKVRLVSRSQLNDASILANELEGCDVVFHLAGVNSHDVDASRVNVELADALVAGVRRLARSPQIVYSNSAHVDRDNPYGRAKGEAAEVLRRWGEESSARFADVVLPNLFGELSRPNYNSAVATFCDAIVGDRPAEVNRNGVTELLHAQDAAIALINHAVPGTPPRARIAGEVLEVGDVYNRLVRFHAIYHGTQNIPRLPTRLDVRLFNQLRVAMYPAGYPVELVRHNDHRGAFFEAVRGFEEGQTSFSTTVPGVTRGEHWHADKIERFLVLRGRAKIDVRRLFDDTVQSFEVSGDRPAFVDMPTLHAHNIRNVGEDELLTMFWTNDHFLPNAPDTWPERVRPRAQVAGGAS